MGRTKFSKQWGKPDACVWGAPGDYEGDITILGGGTFHLLNNTDQFTWGTHHSELESIGWAESVAQPRVYVDIIDVQAREALSFGLGADDSDGAFGQVHAENADISSDTLKAHFMADFYGTGFDAHHYGDVLTGGNLDGSQEFAALVSNTPLMAVHGTYNSDGSVDISAERVSFGEVDDLRRNQKSVADAIEDRYQAFDDVD